LSGPTKSTSDKTRKRNIDGESIYVVSVADSVQGRLSILSLGLTILD